MERSTDGNDFIPINQILAQGIGYRYELIDPAPMPGWNYYRLKEVDIDGRITHYPIKSLFFADDEIEPFTIYPNPVQGRVFNLRLNVKEDYKLGLFDLRGQEVMMRNVSDAISTIRLDLPQDLHPGAYLLSLMNGEIRWSKIVFVLE